MDGISGMFANKMTILIQTFIWLSLYILIPISVNGYTMDDVHRLKQKLFQNYDVGVRPVLNQSLPVDVGVEFILRSIVQVDMSNGQLDTMGYMLAYWVDERMAWNGTEFDDIPSISLKGDELWHPHIIQMNAMADEVQESSIHVSKNGHVIRIMVRQYYTFCSLNMRYYPNDEHDCTFEFVSARYGRYELNLYPISDEIDKKLLSPHGEWVVGDTYAEKKELPYSIGGSTEDNLEFTMKLHRLPLFSTIHRSVPLGILMFGSLFAHVIPLNCGERISYVVTILLALVFWQSLVAEELPKNSSKISIWSIVLTAILCLSGLCTILSIFLVRTSYVDSGKPIPAFLQRLARKIGPNRKQKKQRNQDPDEDNTQSDDFTGNGGSRGHRYRDGFHDGYAHDHLNDQMVGQFNGHEMTLLEYYRHRNELLNNTFDGYIENHKNWHQRDNHPQPDQRRQNIHRHQNDHRNDNVHGLQRSKVTTNGNHSDPSGRGRGRDSYDDTTRPLTWMDVADALDRIFLVLHSVVVFLITVAYVLIFIVDV